MNALRASLRIMATMCVNKKVIRNPKYRLSHNKMEIPTAIDKRLEYITISCGYCIECRRKKAREWAYRITKELEFSKGQMVTLTFKDSELNNLVAEFGQECNGIAYRALRRFCERYRKRYKKAIRHFAVTELGHNGTERIHLHCILFYEKKEEILTKDQLEELWKYGFIQVGKYVNERTANYYTKYMLKTDTDHLGYKQKIYVSKNIGYRKNCDIEDRCKFRGEDTKDNVRTNTGNYIQLPDYYKRKIWSDEEREYIRLKKDDEGYIYIGGNKYERDRITLEQMEEIERNLQFYSEKMGYKFIENKNYNVRNIHTEQETKVLEQKNKKRREKEYEEWKKKYLDYLFALKNIWSV